MIQKNIGQYLVKDENILYSGSKVKVNGEGGFDFAVTNKRIIFAKKRKMHDVRHEHISSISWERQRYWWLIFIGLTCIAISVVIYYEDWSLAGLIIGILLMLLAFFYSPEYLSIYSAGRKLKITGRKELLEKLMRTALEIKQT